MPADAITTDAAAHEIRLADYTPPGFLIDTVDLSFDLDEAATKVTSRLTLRRNPAGSRPISRIATRWRSATRNTRFSISGRA